MWIEVQLQNAKIVIGVLCVSEKMVNRNQFAKELDELLEYLNRQKKKVILLGDMNIDLLKIKSNDCYFQALLSNGMKSLVSFPTRADGQSESLIDHILTNFCVNDNSTVGGTIINNISDHYSTFAVFSQTFVSTRNTTNGLKQRLCFKNYNINDAQRRIHDEKWEDIIDTNNVNNACDMFVSKSQNLQGQVIQTVKAQEQGELHQPG